MALGLAKLMKVVSWGWMVMKLPFFRVTLRRMISEPSSKYKLFIICKHYDNGWEYYPVREIAETFFG